MWFMIYRRETVVGHFFMTWGRVGAKYQLVLVLVTKCTFWGTGTWT